MRCHATTEMMQRDSTPPVVASLDIERVDIARLAVASLAVASLDVASLDVASLDVASLDVASLDQANLGEEEGARLGFGAICARGAATFSCRSFIWTGIWAGEAPIRTGGGTKFSTTPIASDRLCECDTTPALLRKRALTSARWREFRSGMESWRKLRNVQSR